jgi:16S rRNA (guanine966-N2)-methyltransferase
MRIIAGEFRGRRLLPPETDATRPITDRVKQSLFDILAPNIPGSIVYDCFAGTGSMGLECLSRGAKKATFFEIDRSALTRLRQNIKTLNVESSATVIPTDLFRYFSGAPTLPPADLIFLDPPYRFLTEQPQALLQLSEQLAAKLKPEGILIFRHDSANQLQLPALQLREQRNYGGMTLEFHGHFPTA